MSRFKLHNALAAIVSAVNVLNTLSAVSMPVPERKPGLAVVVLWFALLVTHAAVYRFGDRIRERFDLRGYVILQAALIFAIAVSRPPTPVIVGLFMAATVELVILAGARWGTIQITLGAIALFVLASLLTSDLYRATTAGLVLAVTGLIAHAVAALLHRPAPAEAPHTPLGNAPVPANGLSVRETEVLRELVRGARNSDIATTLSITERTVKSHLGSIYQKLGVESRSAAVAAAVQRKLV
jgi:DNA-binding CsgD family transcriptional regulator